MPLYGMYVLAGLLQRDTLGSDDGAGDVASESQEEEDDINYEEVAKAIGKLKNRKAPGVRMWN